MTKEKQIEEIANILWYIPNNYFLNSYLVLKNLNRD